MKKALVLGAAGMIGQAMEYRLKSEDYYVVSVARQPPKYRKSVANEFSLLDLTNDAGFHHHFFKHHFDEAYQLAGSVGGLGFIGTGEHDAEILTDSLKINLHTLEAIRKTQACDKIFFASSQCVYPDTIDVDPYANERIASVLGKKSAPGHREEEASFNTFAFGQEKMFAEKLYDAYARNYGIQTRVARYGNTFGPYCEWRDPKAKAPAAICRKVATIPYAGVVDLWGSGEQTRSFTYIDDVIDGTRKLMASDYSQPVNIAHPEQVSIAELFETICNVANKAVSWKPTDDGVVGVRSRGSDNSRCKQVLAWEPSTSLWSGIAMTYPWIRDQALTKVSA